MHAGIVGELGMERRGQRAAFADGQRLAVLGRAEHLHALAEIGEARGAD